MITLWVIFTWPCVKGIVPHVWAAAMAGDGKPDMSYSKEKLQKTDGVSQSIQTTWVGGQEQQCAWTLSAHYNTCKTVAMSRADSCHLLTRVVVHHMKACSSV